MKPEEQLDKVLQHLDNDLPDRELFKAIKKKLDFDISSKDLELLLNKLVEDRNIEANKLTDENRNPVGGHCYNITYQGRSFLSSTWWPHQKQPYSQMKMMARMQKWYAIAKTIISIIITIITIAIAGFGVFIAWSTYVQDGKTNDTIKKLEQRINRLENKE